MGTGANHRPVHSFTLVRRKQHRAPAAPEQIGDHLVLRHQPTPNINDEHQHVGLCDGRLGLPRHFVNNAVFHLRLEAAGVDYQIGLVTEASVSIVPVPGQSG